MNCFLWYILIFICVCKITGQYYENLNNERNSAQFVLPDPIRHTLGLWSRLLNRMAQTSEPTDDQLRLRMDNYEEKKNTFANERLAGVLNKPNSASKIIDEKKLLELLPPFRETTTITSSTKTVTIEPSTTTTKEPTSTVTTESTTTVIKKSTTTATKKTTKTEAITTKNTKKAINKTKSTTKNLITTTLAPKNNSTITNTTTKTNASEKFKKNKPKKLKTKILDNDSNTKMNKTRLINNNTINNNLKLENDANFELIRKETEELISEIENIFSLQNQTKNNTINDKKIKQILKNNSTKTEKQSSKNKKNVINNNLKNKLLNDTTNLINKTTKNSNKILTTTTTILPNIKSEEIDDDLKDFKIIQTDLDDNVESKKINSTHFDNPSKHKKDKKIQNNNIPEAEEEENMKLSSQHQLNLTAPNVTVEVLTKSNQATISPIASVLDPVNSVVPVKYANTIIDGIGPLILPLLGYSRRAVADFYPKKTQGVTSYQPTNLLYSQKNYKEPNYNGIERIAAIIDQQYQKIFAPNKPLNSNFNPTKQKVEQPTVQLQTLQTENRLQTGLDKYVPQQKINSATIQEFYKQEKIGAQTQTPISNTNVHDSAQELESNNFRLGSNSEFVKSNIPHVDNRLVNAETNYPIQEQIVPSVFASDALRQAFNKLLTQPIKDTSINSQTKAQNILTNYQSNKKSNSNNPDYDLGRSNVEKTFYENSGLRVTDSSLSNATPPPEFSSFSSGSGSGFGGGRRPSVSFDDIIKSER